jgi:Ser/Thr protein kinase RdoA (MazF antagonist)
VAAAPETLANLLARWGVPPDADLAGAERGTNNQTFAVAHGGRRWALRISENLSVTQVRAEHRLLGRLGRAGLPFRVPEPVPALDGETVVPTPAGPATLCRWIPGIRPDLASELQLERFGRAIGALSEALRQVPARDAPHDWRGAPLQIDDGLPGLEDLCLELRAAGLSAEPAMLLKTASQRVAAWWPGAASELPVQVVHGDPGASNTLVDEHTGEVTGLLDFEIAGPDFRVQDLVAGLLQSGALDGPQWQRRTAALVRGSFSVQRLEHAEIQALPELLLCRSVGSVLWRARRWRRGHAQLTEVTARLRELDSTVRWLAAHAGQFLSLVTSSG